MNRIESEYREVCQVIAMIRAKKKSVISRQWDLLDLESLTKRKKQLEKQWKEHVRTLNEEQPVVSGKGRNAGKADK